MRSYYPCRWKRKGCYSLVTLCGSSRFWALMDSLHWREAAETLLVLRTVRSIHLCPWHYLLESEWHSVSPETTENLQEQSLHGPLCCPGRPAERMRHLGVFGITVSARVDWPSPSEWHQVYLLRHWVGIKRKLREAEGTLHPGETALQRLIPLVAVTSSFHHDSQETGTLHLIHNFQDHISFSQIQNGNNCVHRLSKSHYLQNDFLNFIMKNIIDYMARKYQPGVPHPEKCLVSL